MAIGPDLLRLLGAALLAGATPAAAQAPPGNTDLHRAWAAGYRAAFTCSSLWNGAGKSLEAIERDELTGIYPEVEGDVRALKADVDRMARQVRVTYRDDMPPRIAQWTGRSGCVTLPIGAEVRAAGAPEGQRPDFNSRPWPMGDVGARWPVPNGTTRFDLAMMNLEPFGGRTSALLIVKNGRIAFERYWGGHDVHTAQRTFSVAKSMAATLIGHAVQQGRFDVTQPAMIAEWRTPGDPRATITTEQLMRMASGLTSDSAGNRSDAIYMGGASVRQWTVQWPLLHPPFGAFGNRGQYVVVIPSRALVIVRQGYDDDKTRLDIAKLVAAVAAADRGNPRYSKGG